MKYLSLLLTLLSVGGAVAEDCWSCRRADELVAGWAKADTREKRMGVSKASYAFLKGQVEHAKEAGQIAAIVRTLGAMYALDYDPLNDVLSLYRDRLAQPEFRRLFDEEVARLPNDQREKLNQGLTDLAARPRCQGSGKSYRCQ